MAITVPAAGAPVLTSWGADVANQLNKCIPIVSTADTVFNSATFGDITGLSFPVVAGYTYTWQLILMYSVGGITTGLSISHTAPAGTCRMLSSIYGNVSATGADTEWLGAADTATGTSTTDSTNGRMIRLAGHFICTTSGTFQFRRKRNGTSTNVTIFSASGGIVTVSAS